MPQPIHLLDTVAVKIDLPVLGLSAGEVGVVVDIYGEDAVEIEFVDQDGQTYGLHTLEPSQIMPLHQRGRVLQLRDAVA